MRAVSGMSSAYGRERPVPNPFLVLLQRSHEYLDLHVAREICCCLIPWLSPLPSLQAVGRLSGLPHPVETEASGNVTLASIRAIAATGVTFVSVGALTHSVTALDISLNIETQ